MGRVAAQPIRQQVFPDADWILMTSHSTAGQILPAVEWLTLLRRLSNETQKGLAPYC
jgi:hypothetical protein